MTTRTYLTSSEYITTVFVENESIRDLMVSIEPDLFVWDWFGPRQACLLRVSCPKG